MWQELSKKFKVKYSKDRVEEAKRRLKAAFEFKVSDSVPFIFNIECFQPPKAFTTSLLACCHEKALENQVQALNYQFKAFPDCEW